MIKLLITLAKWRRNLPEESFPTPIIGTQLNDHMPTSVGVHLYADPTTFHGSRPVLYADTEGLNAGEAVPVEEVRRRSRGRGVHGGKVRMLEWANAADADSESKSRAFAVNTLYPRILYTFSDVVVFVLKNQKYMTHVLKFSGVLR